MNWFKRLFVKDQNKSFSSLRFQGRVYGFAWVIIEQRDPSYNGEKLKNESFLVVVLKALDFATEQETNIINRLVRLVNEKPRVDSTGEQESILGALEGKMIIYKNMNPELLFLDQEIR